MNTSKVESMFSMFAHCNSLISLNLSSLDTSKVTEMCHTFLNCNKLKYLDLSSFSPLNITTVQQMFANTKSLIYLNLNSFEINNNTYLKNIFYGLPKNVKICSNETNMQNYLFSQNKNNNCSDICFVKNIKLDIIKDECINSCKDNSYNYVCNNICYDECPEGTYPVIKNISNKYNLSIEY